MALIRRTENKQSPAPRRAWDPIQMMDELMRWDPYADFGLRTSLLGGETFTPAFDVREATDRYVFSADLPGVTEDELELSLNENMVTVSGRRQKEQHEEGDRVLLAERPYGAFRRSFTLPEGVDSDKIEAHFEHGVLKITMPKKPGHKPRRISLRELIRSEEQPADEAA